ncbi:MAG: epimerase, partial [Proteobacteria bacterium]
RARHRGARVTVLRFGIVLGAGGGLLARMLPLYRLGLGARFGDGRQWMPWLHLEDAVCMLDAALSDERWHGVVNAVAPEYVSNRGFSEALARAVGRALWFAIPAWMLRQLLGDMATLLVEGQCVAPSRLSELGYRFRSPTLQQALARSVQRSHAAINRSVKHA